MMVMKCVLLFGDVGDEMCFAFWVMLVMKCVCFLMMLIMIFRMMLMRTSILKLSEEV